jgi:hypothetical protein
LESTSTWIRGDDIYSYDGLVKILGEVDDYMHKEKEKFRTLKELYKNLQVCFEKLKTSHNNLKESCEKLKEAQKPSCVRSHRRCWSHL